MKGKDLIAYILENNLEEAPVRTLFRTTKDLAKDAGITTDGIRARVRRGIGPKPLFTLGEGGEIFFPLEKGDDNK